MSKASILGSPGAVTCTACGCLCDDLTVTLDERGQVSGIGVDCPLGRDWFVAASRRDPAPAAVVEGRPVDLEEAIGRVAALLEVARSPVLAGLTATSTETVRTALELAEIVGARVVLDRSRADLGRVAAFQEQGRVGATLGEVRNRADVVVFWGVDPLTTHPRHWERYSAAPGRFVTGRRIVVVDRELTESGRKADRFFKIPHEHAIESLVALRMLARGSRPREDRPELEELAAILKSAHYGALFFQGPSAPAWEQANRLVRDLNESTRFVLLGMGRAGNLAGAEAALTWQAGFLQGVDYRLGRPTPLDDATTLEGILKRREADAVVAIADGWPGGVSKDALAAIPRILIGPGATGEHAPAPDVAIASATTGFDSPGSVMRPDGVALPLRPVRSPTLAWDRDVLGRIVQAIEGRRVP